MVRNMGIARDLGYLKVPPNTVVEAKQLAQLPAEHQVLISTGSQGEPMSALAGSPSATTTSCTSRRATPSCSPRA